MSANIVCDNKSSNGSNCVDLGELTQDPLESCDIDDNKCRPGPGSTDLVPHDNILAPYYQQYDSSAYEDPALADYTAYDLFRLASKMVLPTGTSKTIDVVPSPIKADLLQIRLNIFKGGSPIATSTIETKELQAQVDKLTDTKDIWYDYTLLTDLSNFDYPLPWTISMLPSLINLAYKSAGSKVYIFIPPKEDYTKIYNNILTNLSTGLKNLWFHGIAKPGDSPKQIDVFKTKLNTHAIDIFSVCNSIKYPKVNYKAVPEMYNIAGALASRYLESIIVRTGGRGEIIDVYTNKTLNLDSKQCQYISKLLSDLYSDSQDIKTLVPNYYQLISSDPLFWYALQVFRQSKSTIIKDDHTYSQILFGNKIMDYYGLALVDQPTNKITMQSAVDSIISVVSSNTIWCLVTDTTKYHAAIKLAQRLSMKLIAQKDSDGKPLYLYFQGHELNKSSLFAPWFRESVDRLSRGLDIMVMDLNGDVQIM